jgi:predicted Kef-type K+ transport protein
VLADLTLCVATAWLLAVLANTVRQPLLLAYLAAGFALGAHGLGGVRDPAAIEAVAQLGLIFLLFMVGLEIDLKKVVEAGRTIAVTSSRRSSSGRPSVPRLRLAAARRWRVGCLIWRRGALSSTVVMKVLYDSARDTPPGWITSASSSCRTRRHPVPRRAAESGRLSGR